MSEFLPIAAIILVFVLSFFARKINPGWIMPVIYLAVCLFFIVSAIRGDTPVYVAVIFLLFLIYGAVRNSKGSRAALASLFIWIALAGYILLLAFLGKGPLYGSIAIGILMLGVAARNVAQLRSAKIRKPE